MESENPHYDGGKPCIICKICKLSTIRTTPAGGGEVVCGGEGFSAVARFFGNSVIRGSEKFQNSIRQSTLLSSPSNAILATLDSPSGTEELPYVR